MTFIDEIYSKSREFQMWAFLLQSLEQSICTWRIGIYIGTNIYQYSLTFCGSQPTLQAS